MKQATTISGHRTGHRGQQSHPRALAAPHPGSLRDRRTEATLRPLWPSRYPDDLPKGYHTASRGHVLLHSPDPKPDPLDTARSGAAKSTG
jgi:hypothetical protein